MSICQCHIMVVPIYVRITVDGLRAECSVKRTIDPAHWNSDAERVNKTHPQSAVLNEYLTLVRTEINKHYNILLSTEEHITADMVKERYLGLHLKKLVRKTFMHGTWSNELNYSKTN